MRIDFSRVRMPAGRTLQLW